jgi:hypothetical protein
MTVYKKLQEARILLQNTKLNKSGKNKFAGYEYFELGDFLPQIQNICKNVGLCGMVSFTADTAYLTIHDTDGEGFTTFTSPMSSAALKGCHDVQNLGAVQTYLRRYLWTNAFEIVEHDALDATTGGVEPVKKVEVKPVQEFVQVKPVAKPITGQAGEWQITAPAKPEGDTKEWLDLIKSASHMLLDLTADEEDVMLIFKKNKVLFDTVKATDPVFFKEMMGKFTERKTLFIKE